MFWIARGRKCCSVLREVKEKLQIEVLNIHQQGSDVMARWATWKSLQMMSNARQKWTQKKSAKSGKIIKNQLRLDFVVEVTETLKLFIVKLEICLNNREQISLHKIICLQLHVFTGKSFALLAFLYHLFFPELLNLGRST